MTRALTTLSATDSPRFVVLEGLDGSGKSTVAKTLANALSADLLATPLRELADVRHTVDTVLGDRGMARTLWYAAQVAALSTQVADLLHEGRRVVVDRYWMSTLAYAEAQGTQLDLPEIVNALVVPDVTVLIHVPHDLRLRRLKKRGGDLQPHDQEFMDEKAEERILSAFRRLGAHLAAGRFLEVHLEDESVEEDVRRVMGALGLGAHVSGTIPGLNLPRRPERIPIGVTGFVTSNALRTPEAPLEAVR